MKDGRSKVAFEFEKRDVWALLSLTVSRLSTRLSGSGPPLLMFSPGGFDATLDKWRTLGIYAKIKILDHLSSKFSCIVFDRRESGRSGGRIESLTWQHYVTQAKGLLDHLKIKRAHLMGGCMGCSPVLTFAVAHPELH